MYIAFISPFPGRNLAGAQDMSAVAKYTFKLIQNICTINSRSHKIDIFANQFSGSSHIEEVTDTHHQAHCPAKIHRPMKERWSFLALLKRIQKGKYDIVHIQHETFLYGGPISILLFPIFVFLARLFSPIIVTLHHVIEPNQVDRNFVEIHHSHLPIFIIKLGYTYFYHLVCRAASSITVHDNSDKIILCKYYGVSEYKISVIPHGSDNTIASVTDSHDELMRHFGIPENASMIFGFFAYIDESKGLDYLISEFAEFSKRHPNSTLLIAGSLHPEYKKHQDFVNKFSALRSKILTTPNANIHWYGDLDPKDEGRFYKLVDCVILPYKDFNGGSASLSYAIGNGTPFLVSEKFMRLISNNHLIFPLHQFALTKKLEEFSSRPGILATEARSYSEELMHKQNWNVVANNFLELYSSIVQKIHRRDTIFIGAYGQNNLGDEILLGRCLSYFKTEDCTVASAQPSLTEREYGVAAIHSQRHAFRKFLAFLRAKTIVVGGGDQFKIFKKSVGRFRYALLAQFFLIAVLARLLGKKLYFVGVGIGDVSSALATTLTSWTIRLASFVSLRDRNSFAFVRSHAPHARYALSTDLAFLGPSDNSGIQEASQVGRSHALGIAPVFNIDQAENYPSVTRKIGAALDGYLGEKPHNKAVFLPFQTGFNAHHDIRTSTEILSHVEQKRRCAIDETLNRESAASAYRSLQYLWGMRLHSLILACIHAVPFIALIYDVKVKNFLEEIEYSDWSIPLDRSFSAEKLLALQRELEEQAPDIRHHLAIQAEKLRRKAQINAELLRCIAEGKPFEWHRKERHHTAPAWESDGIPSFASPLPHHHALRQSSWKK